jgi:hypothetical protein
LYSASPQSRYERIIGKIPILLDNSRRPAAIGLACL